MDSGRVDKWVVLRDAVRFAGRRIVHVDAQQLGENAAEILTDVELVGNAGAVAGDNVKIAIGAELQTAAVMAAAGPLEDDFFRGDVNDGRVTLDGEAGHARALRQILFFRVW